VRILVTGGAGFIGSHVVERLLSREHHVTVLDNLATGRRENVPEGVDLLERDVRDRDLPGVLGRVAPEAVIHLAAQMDVRRSVADPAHDADVNVVGAVNLLEAARRAGTRRFVFASTGGAVYGEPDAMPVTEEHPCRPLSPYGASKLAFEGYLRTYHDLHGTSAVVLRLSNVYGPRQDPHGEAGVVAIFSLRCLSGRPCTIFGDGTKTRDYVYVGDVVDAFERSLGRDGFGIYNVGRGVEVSDGEVFATVRRAAGSEAAPVHAERRAGEIERICLSSARARRELGWEPQTDFATGVGLAVSFYRTSRASWD
jgi:UDP-glucose 4-epimerase